MALALYLFGFDDRGREMMREIDAAVARRRAKPDWAGVAPAPRAAAAVSG
jgi:hypothetical protein